MWSGKRLFTSVSDVSANWPLAFKRSNDLKNGVASTPIGLERLQFLSEFSTNNSHIGAVWPYEDDSPFVVPLEWICAAWVLKGVVL